MPTKNTVTSGQKTNSLLLIGSLSKLRRPHGSVVAMEKLSLGREQEQTAANRGWGLKTGLWRKNVDVRWRKRCVWLDTHTRTHTHNNQAGTHTLINAYTLAHTDQ